MDQLKKYLDKNNIKFEKNCGGGININITNESSKKVEKHLNKLKLDHLKRYNWNYTMAIISVF